MNDIIEKYAREFNLDPKLVTAFCRVESSLNPFACRFEPAWKYFKDVPQWAARLRQSLDTERVQQATSWGPMQVMGSVARELGFPGYLSQLADPQFGLKYGCMKLAQFMKKYSRLEDAIASYNAGSPRLVEGGKYVNQVYVDKIFTEIKKL